MLLKLPGFLKNKQSPWLFQHLKVCFSKVINISFVLSFQRLSSLWDVDLVFMLESPYQASRNHFSKVLLSGTEFLGDQARSWPPLHVTDFLRDKMQLMMSMVLAKVSEESKVLMCPTAQQSLASAASIHPQCSQERCKAK